LNMNTAAAAPMCKSNSATLLGQFSLSRR
jgi:hypothetical protein